MASAPTSSAARSQAWIWTVRFTTESQHIGPGAAPLGRSSGCPRFAGLRRTISRFGGLRMALVPRLRARHFEAVGRIRQVAHGCGPSGTARLG